MKTISDMKLNLSHGHERVERQLLRRSERFSKEFKRLDTPEDAFGVRITAIPVGNTIQFDRVFHHGKIVGELDMPSLQLLQGTDDNKSRLEYPDRFIPSGWQPILRGSRAESGVASPDLISYHEIHCDGLVEWGYVMDHSEPPQGMNKFPMFPSWPISMFANVTVWADRIRKQAALPTEGYAIEVEMRIVGSVVPLSLHMHGAALEPDSVVFPKYLLGDPPEDVFKILSSFHRDFWNYCGRDINDERDRLEIQGQGSP